MSKLNMEMYDQIVKECRDISVAKSKDYGTDSLTGFGALGIVVRMSDKMARLKNLIQMDKTVCQVMNESLEDTAMDMINYSLYLVMTLRNKLLEEQK